ncbi:MAG: division/cell wall cluster transcriptional repressor MraZ [Oscillospiraceae bacterium]
MLIGEYQHTLDVKGRIHFPAKLREDLGETFIVTKGLDNCLFVYSLQEWSVLEDKIRSLPMSKSRGLQRFLFSGAVQVEPDKQGRIMLPINLREYASLDKEVMVIGASVRAEIWNKEKWNADCEEITSDMVSQAMEELGF